MLKSVNPYNGKTIKEYAPLTDDQLNDSLDAANAAFPAWRDKSFAERGKVLKAVAEEMRAQKDFLARTMAEEMGKPVKEGGPETEKAAWCAEFYADNAEEFLKNQELPSDASLSYVCHQPLGTILGILPWNAPMWLAFRFLAPALMAGNTCAMKHDPNVQGSAKAIADIFDKVGAPKGVMVNLPLETARVEPVIKDKRIAGVSFTGSSGAGAKVASAAGSVVKRSVLELGGSDPCIVLADADLEKAADIAVLSRIINAGQSCIAAKRILVEKPVYQKFTDMVKARLEKLKLGDPTSENTDIGPIARDDLRQNLHRQVMETVKSGAKCLLGGELPEGQALFYPVTLLTDVKPDMCAFREETFGPVMVMTPVDGPEHALELANDTDFGLGAAVWTGDSDLALSLANRIVSGQVAINGIVKTDPRLPSGGVKSSGIGRELGPHGIREFVNAKQIWIK